MSLPRRWRQENQSSPTLAQLAPIAVVGMAFVIAVLVAAVVGGRPASLTAETSPAPATATATSVETGAPPVPSAQTPPTTLGSPAALLVPPAASPEPAEAQTFDLEPLTSSGRGWTRSDPAVGVVAFPTSVDRSLKLPAGKGRRQHSACRPFHPSTESPTRIVADVFVSRPPDETGPVLVIRGLAGDQGILEWSGSGISASSAPPGAANTAALTRSTWYRVAVQIAGSSPFFRWEVAQIDPWRVVLLTTGETSDGRAIDGDGLCFVGPPAPAAAALYVDGVVVERAP